MVYETYKTKTKKPINETKDSVYWDAVSPSFVGRISDSVIRQKFTMGYTNSTYK